MDENRRRRNLIIVIITFTCSFYLTQATPSAENVDYVYEIAAQYNKTFEVECDLGADSVGVVVWYKYNRATYSYFELPKPLVKPKYAYDGAVLRINNVVQTDSGLYQCGASNSHKNVIQLTVYDIIKEPYLKTLNLTIKSTKALAANRLSVVFQIDKLNNYEQIKLIYLLFRKSDNGPVVRGILDIEAKASNQSTESIIVNDVDLSDEYRMQIYHAKSTTLNGVNHYLILNEILKPIQEFNSIYSNIIDCKIDGDGNLYLNSTFDKLRQLYFKPTTRFLINEFLDNEANDIRVQNNCLINENKSNCLLKVSKKRQFNAFIDNNKSQISISSVCNMKKATVEEIVSTEPAVKTTDTSTSRSTTSTPRFSRITTKPAAAATTTTTTTKSITTTQQYDELEFSFNPDRLKSKEIIPPSIIDCLIIDSRQIQIKLEHHIDTLVTNNLYYFIEYKLEGANSTSNISFQARKNSTQTVNLLDTKNTEANSSKKTRKYLITLYAYTIGSKNSTYEPQRKTFRIECKMPTSNSYPILGVLCAAIFAVLLILIGFIICIVIRKRYNGAQNYLNSLSKKNSIFKKSKNGNDNENVGNHHIIARHYSQTSQKELLSQHSNKSSTFNTNYVRLLKQKWHLNSDKDNTNERNLGNNSSSCGLLNVNSSINTISFYPTSFTNTIRSKFNQLKAGFYVYKDDHDSINVPNFEAYVQKMHVDGDIGFAQLYDEICAVTKSYSYSSEISLIDANRTKNRYSNILTYDHSRVKLSFDEKDDSLGYINANYIDGYQKQNAYIATQGPMPHTFADFWKMIWEQNCSIIIMITNVREKGRIKCDQYWPDEGCEVYGNVQCTFLHAITLAFYTKRIFTLKLKGSKKRGSAERLVYQYHFTDWPDHGVPIYILPVLSFIKKSSNANPEFGGPIVVHCSAGVGRTGTYIVIDAMMRQIEQKQTINVHTFLKHIRHQRNYLVQTEEQFIFIYDALLESIKSGNTELTEHNYKLYIDCLAKVDNYGTKFIEKQFELITDFKPKEYHMSFAQMAYNRAKNRNQSIVPMNTSRVILSKKPGVDGSEYINASYLYGSNRYDEFIITQHPMQEIRSNFWQMVWDNNSNHVVALYGDDKLDKCENYWLEQGIAMKCDSFTVILKDETFEMDFVYRDFLLQSIDEDYEFNCRIISACYWPDSCAPIKSAFDLLNKIRQLRGATNMSLGPIIVHDLFGGSRAATFCSLWTFQDLIQLESNVNVYEIAKMYHLKRPGIWNNTNNILFLYQAVECLLDEHLQKQLKRDSNGNISSNSSTSVTTPCSTISPSSAIIPMSSSSNTNRLSQTLSAGNNNTVNSLDKIIKSAEPPLYDNANIVIHTLPSSSSVENKAKSNKTLSIGKRNAARLLMDSMITKSSNFKRAFLATVTNHHGNNITENNTADTATVIETTNKHLNV